MKDIIIIEIDEKRAREILESVDCCFSGNLNFLLDPIKGNFPELAQEFCYLFKEQP